ncbi:hypothetical protein [Brachymonas sp. G13]
MTSTSSSSSSSSISAVASSCTKRKRRDISRRWRIGSRQRWHCIGNSASASSSSQISGLPPSTGTMLPCACQRTGVI